MSKRRKKQLGFVLGQQIREIGSESRHRLLAPPMRSTVGTDYLLGNNTIRQAVANALNNLGIPYGEWCAANGFNADKVRKWITSDTSSQRTISHADLHSLCSKLNLTIVITVEHHV